MSFTDPDRRRTKQVIVIRHDLHMRQGKAVAQGAHAAMMFLLVAHREPRIQEKYWLNEGMRKVCVRVDSEAELQDVMRKAEDAGLKVYAVTDAGHTEFHGVPTLTCCAIGPDYEDAIDAVTGKLKLL